MNIIDSNPSIRQLIPSKTTTRTSKEIKDEFNY